MPKKGKVRIPFIFYADINADIKSSLAKMSTCHNNPKKSSPTKATKHLASGYSLFTHCSIDANKNKLEYYRDRYCTEKFCKDLIPLKKGNDIISLWTK